MKLNTRSLQSRWVLITALLFWAGFSRADEEPDLCNYGYPAAHELFTPLLADPRELQYSARAAVPVSHRAVGEIAFGDYLGLRRWCLGNRRGHGHLQLSIGGGLFSRFDLSNTKDLEVVDFYGNVPIDWRQGPWSARFMLYHTSSHLGDDFIRTTGRINGTHEWNNLRWLLSYDASTQLRLYGGYTYIVSAKPENQNPNAVQAGFGLFSKPFNHNHSLAYWANDFQSWGRTAWNPTFNSQLGIKIARELKPHARAASRETSFFIEFFTGHQPQGQFYLQQETRWGFGIKFDLT